MSDDLLKGILDARMDERINALIQGLKAARETKDKRKYYAAISMITHAVEEKDDYTARHTERVTLYSLVLFDMLTQEEAFKQYDNETMRYVVKVSALLHDVGKLVIRDEVLKKTGKLTDEEFNEMKLHPAAGFEVARLADESPEILKGIRFHHERPDGRGYPEGLQVDQIPFVAGIIAVADSYDAMTSDRPYRKALPREVAAAEIAKWKGTQFMPYAADAFARAFAQGLI